MGSPRLPDEPSAARRRPAATALPLPPDVAEALVVRDVLLRSWPGRLFIIATLLKLVVAVWRRLAPVPSFVQVLSSAATLGLAISVGYLLWRLFVLVQRQLLWRVRRKLILSYIFIGVVPTLLIMGFCLIGAGILSMNIGAYLFKDGYDDVVRNSGLIADAIVSGVARTPRNPADAVERVHANATGLGYPACRCCSCRRRATRTGECGPDAGTRRPRRARCRPGSRPTATVSLARLRSRSLILPAARSSSSGRFASARSGSWWWTCRSTAR